MVDDEYFSVQDSATRLKVDDETILSWIHSGELPAVNITKKPNGKRPTWRIPARELGLVLLKRSNSKPTVATPKIEKRPKPKQYV
jgi:excisionase family DNA binding protein